VENSISPSVLNEIGSISLLKELSKETIEQGERKKG
jgi:hypothetical protein